MKTFIVMKNGTEQSRVDANSLEEAKGKAFARYGEEREVFEDEEDEEEDNFKLHLTTTNYKFFVDVEESDENGSTKMYDHDGKLISDNYHASQFLWEILAEESEEEITFISDEMEYNRKEIMKEKLQNQ